MWSVFTTARMPLMTIPRAAQLSQVSPSIYDLVKCRGDEWCISSNGRHTQSRGESSVFFVQTMTTTLQLPQPTPTLIPLSTLLNFTTCSFDFIIARYLSTHFYVSLASGWSVLIAPLEQKKNIITHNILVGHRWCRQKKQLEIYITFDIKFLLFFTHACRFENDKRCTSSEALRSGKGARAGQGEYWSSELFRGKGEGSLTPST